MNDGDVAAQPLHNFKYVRGEKNSSAARDHALQHGFQGSGGDCVHAFEWLVAEKTLGSMNPSRRHRQFFLHPMGIIGDQLLRLIGELHEVEQFGGATGGGLAVKPVHATSEV